MLVYSMHCTAGRLACSRPRMRICAEMATEGGTSLTFAFKEGESFADWDGVMSKLSWLCQELNGAVFTVKQSKVIGKWNAHYADLPQIPECLRYKSVTLVCRGAGETRGQQ